MQSHEQMFKMRTCYAAGFEDEERGQEPRNVSGLFTPVQARKWILP